MISTVEDLSQKKLKSIQKLKMKKYRYLSHTFIGEGYRMFSEAIKLKPQALSEVILSHNLIDTTQHNFILKKCSAQKIPVYSCSERIMGSISDEKTPSGILFIAKFQLFSEHHLIKINRGNCLYLENISDPGNLGAIIRTAAWYGIKNIFLSPATVDPFNSKTVRATAGGIFYVHLFNNIQLADINKLADENGFDLISTIIQGGIPLDNWKVSDKNIIFFGSEANGLTQSALNMTNKSISILGSGEVESLNLSVAAGIMMNHVYRFQGKT